MGSAGIDPHVPAPSTASRGPAISPRLPTVVLLLGALVGAAGCGLAGPGAPQAADVRAAAVRLEVALDRATDAHTAGRHEEAVAAWRDAHLAWDETLAPGLEARIGAQEVVSLELHLARIRAAIDSPGADVKVRVEQFGQALDSPLRSLPPAPDPQVPAGDPAAGPTGSGPTSQVTSGG